MKKIIIILLMVNCSISYAQHCVHCMYYRNQLQMSPYQNTGFNQVSNYYMPWWNNYSSQRYRNYNMPSAWSNFGINGNQYPSHHGGGMAGKPNVYIYGKKGTEFSIKLKFEQKSFLLASVPSYRTSWRGIVSSKGVDIDSTKYPYLYYDYIVNIDKMQWRAGKCVSESKLMPYLNNTLKQHGFNKNEINDFNEYWSFKIPSADEYCIFPQGNKELHRVVEVVTIPKARLNRLVFFIVPQVKTKRFRKLTYFNRPKLNWTVSVADKDIKKEKLLIHEWGIAWLDEKYIERINSL